MPTKAQVRIGAVIAVALLLAALSGPARHPAPARLPPSAPSPQRPPRGHSPFEQAFRAASWDRMEAKLAINREREVMDGWDPAACGDQADGRGDPDAWRLRQLALDPSGALHRARAFALHAAKLARGPDEAYRAAELLVLIEHEAGHHAQELQEARHLVKLRPESPRVAGAGPRGGLSRPPAPASARAERTAGRDGRAVTPAGAMTPPPPQWPWPAINPAKTLDLQRPPPDYVPRVPAPAGHGEAI